MDDSMTTQEKVANVGMIILPTLLFGVILGMKLEAPNLKMDPLAWFYVGAATLMLLTGLVRLFEIPILSYRIKVVRKEDSPQSPPA